MHSQRRLIDSGETSWLHRAAAAVAPTAPPCPGTTWKNRSRGGVSCGLKRAPPVIGASTRARLSSGTHHPDADVVSEDLQGDREVPVVERNSIARAKWPAGKIAPRERGAATARLMRTGSAIRQASQEGYLLRRSVGETRIRQKFWRSDWTVRGPSISGLCTLERDEITRIDTRFFFNFWNNQPSNGHLTSQSSHLVH